MIGVAGVGTYLPEARRTAEEIGALTGIPADVIRSKFGVECVRVASAEETATEMATAAARRALDGFPAEDLDLVVYCGSEYKDHVVWSAATDIARKLGAMRAAAFEVHALCAGLPIALKTVRAMAADDPAIRSVVVVGGGKENDLVDYGDARGRFLSNFGAGMGALFLRRDHPNPVLGAAFKSDPSCSRDVVTIDGRLRVPDPAGMKERLDPVSLANFVEVARRAMAQAEMDHADFVALTHMKRSMHEAVLGRLGVSAEHSVYLEDAGHMQSADQALALERGLERGLVRAGSSVLLLAAGTGYTWSAATIRWET
jgi:3-oxoacyl-[acyl-carrier-protein] synthase III